MVGRGQEGSKVYLVTVKENNSYTTLPRVFKDKERAIHAMHEKILEIELPLSKGVKEGRHLEFKKEHIEYIKDNLKKHESETKVEFTREKRHLLGTRTETVDVIIGRVEEIEIE